MSQTREDNLSSVGRTALGLLVLGFSSAVFGALVVGPRLGEQLVPAASALERRTASGQQPAGSDEETASVAREGGDVLASAAMPEPGAPSETSTSDRSQAAAGVSGPEPTGSGPETNLGMPGAADTPTDSQENVTATLPTALPGAAGTSLQASGSDSPRPAVAVDAAAEQERTAAKAREAEALRAREAEARAERQREEERRRERAAELARQERERKLAQEREREREAEREREQRLAAERERREEEQRREAARKSRKEAPQRTVAGADRKNARDQARPAASERAERKTEPSPRTSPVVLPAVRPEVAEDQGVFKVRVGRFKSREEAEKVRDALIRSAGKEAFLVREGETYRLQVGAYKDRANADKVAEELQGAGSRPESGSNN